VGEGFWRIVCSYKGAEASGSNRGATLAVPKRSSPLQVIEKRKLKNVPKWANAGPFGDGQVFGANRKLLGNSATEKAGAVGHFDGMGCI
jgi:hypothetical protein